LFEANAEATQDDGLFRANAEAALKGRAIINIAK